MSFRRRIHKHVAAELQIARRLASEGDARGSFRHLERAHVLGQASTVEHVRVHVRMLGWALRHHDFKEVRGQLLRISGAATKTALGLVPRGNTGGSNVSPFKPMPISPDLAQLLDDAPARDG